MQSALKSDTEPLGPLTLDEFPPHSYKDWKLAAEKLLKGAPFAKRLVAKTYEGFDLQPIYRREDLADLKHLTDEIGGTSIHRGNYSRDQRIKTWKIAQETAWQDPQAFNAGIRKDISSGVTESICPINGIYGLQLNTTDDLITALTDVDLTEHRLTFEPETNTLAFADLLIAYLIGSGEQEKTFSGSIAMDPLGELVHNGDLPDSLEATFDKLASLSQSAKESLPSLQTITASGRPYANGGSSSSQELGYTLATAVEYVRELQKRGVDLSTITSQLRFSLSIGPHFFMEIAKFRAIRLLWAQIIKYMGGDAQSEQLFLHARTGTTNKTIYDPQVNILRTCTEGLAAILGGCDSLTIAPYDELEEQSSNLARRIARNMHGILAEECNFNRVVDPGGGSYFLENLTDQLADEAWKTFQSVEEAGGMSEALKQGLPQSAIQSTVAQKRKNVAIGRNKLVGTNSFPNPSEKADAKYRKATPPTGDKVTTIPTYRLTEDYEQLRKASESLAESRGHPPRILQINLGPSRRYRLRADWISSFFEVGGFEVLNEKDFADIDSVIDELSQANADFAILTSDDTTYASEGVELAKRVKEAQPKLPLFLAGAPGDNETELRDAGINEFIHIRTNNYEALESLLKELGAL